jgi:hypothetical protein
VVLVNYACSCINVIRICLKESDLESKSVYILVCLKKLDLESKLIYTYLFEKKSDLESRLIRLLCVLLSPLEI